MKEEAPRNDEEREEFLLSALEVAE